MTDKGLVEDVFNNLDKNGDTFVERENFIDYFVRHYTNPDLDNGQAYFISAVMS